MEKVFEMHTAKDPIVLIIRLLEACNAGCFMCDFAFSKDPYRFSLEDCEELMTTLTDTSVRLIRFTGGEPLLHNSFKEIVSIFARRYVVSTITNGFHLAEKAEELSQAGLAQVIVSIDGINDKHDRYRKLPGLFNACCEGLSLARSLGIKTRVNTVVGPHNYTQLPDLYVHFASLGVEQWSLIPLKRADGAWENTNLDQLLIAQEELAKVVQENGPKFIGYSLNWAGRTREEANRLHESRVNLRPTTATCEVVDKVRYYVPGTGMVYPCNCVPHRNAKMSLGESWTALALNSRGMVEIRDYLRTNGPLVCPGCEPANAALGEGKIDLLEDPLAF